MATGLASGVDTSSIVSQLMTLDHKTTTRMTYRQAAVTADRRRLTNIAVKLSALKRAANAQIAAA
jgi:flagellar capping protein FliD